MRKIINGKVYDTATAQEICNISPSGYSRSDFGWEDTTLYQTKKCAFFIAGEGGPNSRWAHHFPGGGRSDGNGLELIDASHAKSLVEQHASEDTFIAVFGKPEEG